MTIRFCVILMGLCNQVSSLIFWFLIQVCSKYFLLQVGSLLTELFWSLWALLSVQVIYLVVYRVFLKSLFIYDRVSF